MLVVVVVRVVQGELLIIFLILFSRWTLIGITSAGFGCAVDKQPGIYHKIGKTTGWILSQISSKISTP